MWLGAGCLGSNPSLPLRSSTWVASVLQSHRVTVGLNELVYRKPSCPSSQRHVLGLVLLFSSMHATSLTSISPFNVTDDISRVKLSVQTHSTDDYVNANYMPVSGQMTRSTGLLHQKRQVLLSGLF